MKLLIITDSHGVDLAEMIMVQNSSFIVMDIVKRGGTAASLHELTWSKRDEIQKFNPSVVILHVGCNSVAFHAQKNPINLDNQVLTADIQLLMDTVDYLVPDVHISVSCLFPRIPSRFFSKAESESFNHRTFRLAGYFKQKKWNTIYCRELWQSRIKLLAWPHFYKPDGLHLLPSGKRVVAETWVNHVLTVGIMK